MTMTHYMELIATNQPWNLIIFMAIPVILAETVAITELHVLYTRDFKSGIRKLNKWAGILSGIYFSGVFLYLFKNAVIPLTQTGGWRGPADLLAVGFYLFGVVPLAGIAMLETGIIAKGKTDEEKLKIHAGFVCVFLLVAHIAMVFGMLNPEILGYHASSLMKMH